MINLKLTIFASFLLIFGNCLTAQNGVIYLINPSFEGMSLLYSAPAGWKDCGAKFFPKETPPDIHPMVNEPY